MKVLTILGTRPEAIKLAPVIKQIEKTNGLISCVCSTGQHKAMLDQVKDFFELEFDHELKIMTDNQTLSELTAKLFFEIPRILAEERPDFVLVHGDTATTFAGALSSFQAGIRVGHVEAGLRSQNIFSPWPEEANRKLTSIVTNYHFAPTTHAKNNLLAEGIDRESIKVTGNTVIDALLYADAKIKENRQLVRKLNSKFHLLLKFKQLILITVHRRESFGEPLQNILNALHAVAKLNRDTAFVIPVHLNPQVSKPIKTILSDCENVFLLEPLDYPEFVFLMQQSLFVITDSGGIQEEAPTFNKSVLVVRDVTERVEGVEAGFIHLIGTQTNTIIDKVSDLLNRQVSSTNISSSINPYGDGSASKIIVDQILDLKSK